MTAPAVDTRPFAPFEWLLAMRYLRARRKEGFISVIAGFSFAGILLGVATLIIVMAVMNGFRKELFAKILGLDGHVIAIRVDNADFPDYNEYARKLEAAPTIKRAVPLIEGQVLASTAFMAVGAKVRGISADGLSALPQIANNVKLGTLDGFDDRTDSIAVGIGFMRVLRINVGDTITLTSPRGARTPFGTVPRTKSYKVAAMFEMGMDALAARIAARTDGRPTFVSFDLDFVDPAAAPGVATPEAGGPDARQALDLLRRLKGIDLVGCDVVEVVPQFDGPSHITALLAATVLAELIALKAEAHAAKTKFQDARPADEAGGSGVNS